MIRNDSKGDRVQQKQIVLGNAQVMRDTKNDDKDNGGHKKGDGNP